MRIFLIFLLFISASLLAWVEYLRRHPEEAFWNKPHITQQAEAQAEGTEASPSPAQAEPTDALVEEAPNELQTIEEEYVQQMREYWYALLDTDRDWNSPAKRTDLAREIHFLTNLGVEESITYWELLQQMPPEFAADKDAIATAIINNVAMRDPVEAVSMLLASGDDYPSLDYPMIVRLWMDEEGTSVMDWLDDMDDMGANNQLKNAFLDVYAEEDPMDFLANFSQQGHPESRIDAINYLYSQYGATTLNEIANYTQDPGVIASAFQQIGATLAKENLGLARQFIQANRYQVSEEVAQALNNTLLDNALLAGGNSAIEALDWSLDQQLIDANSEALTNILNTSYHRNPLETVDLITHLVNRTGSMQDTWAAILNQDSDVNNPTGNLMTDFYRPPMSQEEADAVRQSVEDNYPEPEASNDPEGNEHSSDTPPPPPFEQ